VTGAPPQGRSPASGASRLPDARRFRPDEVRFGTVTGLFGIRGEVRVYLYNPASTLLRKGFDVALVAPDGARRAARISTRSGAGKRILGRIDGISTPEAAETLVDWEICVPKAALPPTDEGEWYHHELLGLPVRTASGEVLGRLAEIHATGEMDVWVVRSATEEHFVPVLLDLIERVVPGVEIVLTDEPADHLDEDEE
jgi:16S rRNA processing protein RimM